MKKQRLVILAMFLALLALVPVLSGCNGVMASSDMEMRLQNEAAKAKVCLEDTRLTKDEAAAYVVVGSGALADYYKTATVNPFAYGFTDGKGLLLSAKYFSIVRRGSIMAIAARDQIHKADEDHAGRIARAIAKIVYKIELARQGEDE